ncbi:MAG: substrate-binding domain-containing protein, partial [Candidatus Limnocylindrales bacterium]
MTGALLAATSLVVASCSAGATGAPSAGRSNLTVYAAASLAGALDVATTNYQASHPDVSLTISTGSSAALETQIE